MPTTYPFAVANIRSRPRMPEADVVADVEAVAFAAQGGIIAWSEISHPDYAAAVADLAEFTTYHPAGTDVPISWDPTRFQLIDCGSDFGNRATLPIAPARHTVWVLLRDLLTGGTVGVLNPHMIPGGWSPKQVVRRSLRRMLWKRHQARILRRLADLRSKADRVHLAGDINRPGLFTFPGLRRSSGSGVIYLGSAGAVAQSKPVRVRLNSDHDLQVVTMTPRIPRPRPVPAPAPPYVGPAKFHGDGNNKPIHRIVIHATVSPCRKGGARGIAKYFRETVTRPSSAHYVVDPGEAVQVVYDSVVAYHAPPNQHAIGVELCDPQTGPATRWCDKDHERMLLRAARLVAQLALAYDVPLVKVGPSELVAGKHGICGHVDVTNAFHQTTHTDPGDGFPWEHFMALVRDAATSIKEKH